MQHDQPGRTVEQVLRQFTAPLHEMRNVVTDEQLLLPIALQEVGCDFWLPRPQRMLHRLAHFAAVGKPLAGTQVRLGGRCYPGHAS